MYDAAEIFVDRNIHTSCHSREEDHELYMIYILVCIEFYM